MTPLLTDLAAPDRRLMVRVLEPGETAPPGWTACLIGTNIEFSIERLESYFFKKWDVLHYDLLLIAAAVEYCDMIESRLAFTWSRDIYLDIPVHQPERWKHATVSGALHEALAFLTGDRWTIRFHERKLAASGHGQAPLELETTATAVIPFSNGLDSCSVADLKSRELGAALVRIRLGPDRDMRGKGCRRVPFTNVPYRVKGERNEASMRSRGFKFGVVSGLAAYLADAPTVIMPASGQGALGPTLVSLGQMYPDYRTHPAFLRRVERFLAALLNQPITYDLPRLWFTKGETLAAHLAGDCRDPESWRVTRSCWQQSRHAAVDNKLRQCGICAACILRRVSVHAAGQAEAPETYVWEDLSASKFADGATPAFDRSKITGKMRDYAIAGALHLDHLAAIRRSPSNQTELDLQVFQLARACGLSGEEARTKLDRLLVQHEQEWNGFLESLGPGSFLRRWAAGQ